MKPCCRTALSSDFRGMALRYKLPFVVSRGCLAVPTSLSSLHLPLFIWCDVSIGYDLLGFAYALMAPVVITSQLKKSAATPFICRKETYPSQSPLKIVHLYPLLVCTLHLVAFKTVCMNSLFYKIFGRAARRHSLGPYSQLRTFLNMYLWTTAVPDTVRQHGSARFQRRIIIYLFMVKLKVFFRFRLASFQTTARSGRVLSGGDRQRFIFTPVSVIIS